MARLIAARRIVVPAVVLSAVVIVPMAQAQTEPVLTQQETKLVMAEAEAAGSVESTFPVA
jgi:hypothetical protein